MNQQPAAKKPKAPPTQKKPVPKKPSPAAAPGVLMYIEGQDGQITVKADRIVITRRGLFNILMYGFSAQREVLLSAISEVIFKEANMLSQGHIEFIVAGRHQTLHSGKIHHNAVKFTGKKQAQFVALKEKVFALMKQNQQKTPS